MGCDVCQLVGSVCPMCSQLNKLTISKLPLVPKLQVSEVPVQVNESNLQGRKIDKEELVQEEEAADWSRKAVFCVMDELCDPDDPVYAIRTLPPILLLEKTANTRADHNDMGVWTTCNLPDGMRFGPYFPEESFIIHGRPANWMRFVQAAESKGGENLVAYQDGGKVFFQICPR